MKKIFLFGICLFLFLASCARQTKETGNNGTDWVTREAEDALLPGVNPLKVKGNIIIAGSSTVFPLAERIAERFKNEGYSGNITIDSIGSGAGFERFCVTGETDIANASRPIKASERESAERQGRIPLEFKIGTDALAVVVSKENTFVKSLSLTELALVFGGIKRWSEIHPDWPDQDILRFIPGTDSGTFDYFVETVFNKDKKTLLDAANLQLSEDDNILVQGVLGSPYSIGFFGYAYYAENRDKLRVIDIGGITPDDETVDKNTYPLARPLFLYSSANILQARPQVAAFLDFFLTYVSDEIKAVGYFPAHPQVLEGAKKLWLEAAEGLY